jgi:hypothetical protein
MTWAGNPRWSAKNRTQTRRRKQGIFQACSAAARQATEWKWGRFPGQKRHRAGARAVSRVMVVRWFRVVSRRFNIARNGHPTGLAAIGR